MRRFIFAFSAAAAALMLLAGCKPKAPGAKPVDIDWQEGDVVAVAFLGYYDSFAALEAAPSYVRLTKTFPQIVGATKVDTGMGREIFLVIPRDPMATLSVNRDGPGVFDGDQEVLYRSETGEPVLVSCNFSKANSEVVCVDNAGHSVTFNPWLDKQGGKVRLPRGGGVKDVSLPLPAPLEGYTQFDYGEDFDGNDLGIRVRLEAGRPVLTCNPESLASIGWEEDMFVIASGDNQFTGINGLCKGVFLGTIGQDYNPVVCVVTDGGEVKICGVFYAMQHGEPELSDPLPGFKDVTGFESGGGGPWEDEDGETMYSYQTIYALDARGGRTEIPWFNSYGLFMAEDGGDSVEVMLTPDWHFYLTRYNPDGDLSETYYGSFFETDRDDESAKYAFRQTGYGRLEEDGTLKMENRIRTGKFTAREEGFSYAVNLTGSDAFKSGTLFRDERMANMEDDIEYD